MACHLPKIPETRGREKVSGSTRLPSLDQSRRIDQLRRAFPLPEYAVPKVAKTLFPSLAERPLQEKFPHSRTLEKMDLLYYTRGKLGEKIMGGRTKLDYTVEDEYNQKKVVRMSSYDPLHDPNLASYLSRPAIKHHLESQGLLRDKNHVVCNLKNFNEFRQYLGVAQNDRLASLLRQQDERDVQNQAELTRNKALAAWTIGSSQKREDANVRRRAHEAEVRNRMTALIQRNEGRRVQAEKKKAEVLRDEEFRLHVENDRKMTYDKVKLPCIADKRMTMLNIIQRETNTDMKLLAERMGLKRFLEARKVQRAETKAQAQLIHSEILKTVQQRFAADLKSKALERNERCHREWKRLPLRIEKGRAEKRRIDALVRKYFYRWLYKVRERRRRREEEKRGGHDTVWDVPDTLDKGNNLICENRLKIVDAKSLLAAAKRQIQLEIEWEEEK